MIILWKCIIVPLENTGKTITKIQPLKKSVRVYIGKAMFALTHQRYTDFFLYPGKVITPLEYSQIEEAASLTQLETYALRLLGRGPYTSGTLKNKLYAKGAKRWMVEAILKQLEQYQLLNDEQYIVDRFDYGKMQLHGYDRIINDLLEKGIDAKLLEKHEYHEGEEIDKAEPLWERLAPKLATRSQRAAIDYCYDWYMRHGYRTHVIRQIIDKKYIVDQDQQAKNIKIDYETAIRKYQSRYKGKKLQDRLFQYLAQKGYNYAQIKHVIGGIDDAMD